MDKNRKINWIEKFQPVAHRAGFYARCDIQNLETGQQVEVFLAAPQEVAHTEYFTPENMNAGLRELADQAMYEFLYTEDFSKKTVLYFEWLADNKFHLLE